MQETNYFQLRDFPTVQFIGFSKVTTFAYITISQSKDSIIVETQELPVRSNRFRIELGDSRVAHNARLYHLINHHELENQHFVYNQIMQNYFASDIIAN